MKIKEIIDKELNSKHLITKLRENDSLIHYTKNLIVNHLCKQIDLEVDFKKAHKSFCKKNNISKEEELTKYLILKGMLYDDHKRNLINSEKIIHIAHNEFSEKAKSDFLNNKTFLDIYTYYFLNFLDSDSAHEIYFRLESKEMNLDSLNADNSIEIDFKYGKVGPTDLLKIKPIIRDQLINLELGNFTSPFKFNNNWIILFLKDKKDAIFDGITKSKMVLALFDEWINVITVDSLKKFLI